MQKGQISIEYLLIISLMLLYITVIILPNVDVSTKSAKEIAGISQARTAAEKIVNTANEVALSGEQGRQTITVYAPVGVTINCDPSTDEFPAAISFQYDFNAIDETGTLPTVDACTHDEDESIYICSKIFTMVSGYNISCAETFPLQGGETGKLTTVTIDKTRSTELLITANP